MIRVSTITALLALISGTCLSAFAQSPPELSRRAGTAVPISKLPPNVIAPVGQLTLFADFNDFRKGEWSEGIVLYLVNRTDKRIGFRAQDDDLYVKLEAKNARDEWERAQGHVFSDCGNSYTDFPSLSPSEFFTFLGYSPREGELREIHYHIYANEAFALQNEDPSRQPSSIDFSHRIPIDVTSNVGRGRVKLDEIAAARRDRFALRSSRFKDVREMATGVISPDPAPGRSWTRAEAVRALYQFAREDCLELLNRYLVDGDPDIRNAAVGAIAELATNWEPAQHRYQELLHDEDIDRRASAVNNMPQCPTSPKEFSDLIALLKHPDAKLRMEAVRVIVRSCMQIPEARDRLGELRDDPNPRIASWVRIALDRLYPDPICPMDEGKP